MFSIFSSAIFYNIVLLLCVILLNKSEKINYKRISLCHRKTNGSSADFIKIRYCAYFIIWFVSIIRYDIGADYENTVFDIIDITKSINRGGDVVGYIAESMKEPGLFVLTLLFSQFQSTHIWVIGSYFSIFLIFLYKLLNLYNIHKWGIVILFFSIIIFQSWDWIRQSTAMIIMLYAISLFNNKRVGKSLICVIFSILFHYSALFVVPFMLLFHKVKIDNKMLASILLVSFVLAILGFFKSVYDMILGSVPFYGELYQASSKYVEFDEQSYSDIPFVINSLWYIFVVYFANKNNHHPWVELLFVGALLFMMSGGSLLMDRLAWFFTCSQLVLAPMVCRDNKGTVFKSIFWTIITIMFVLLNRRFTIRGEARGCVPYQTIISDEAQTLKFRYKED